MWWQYYNYPHFKNDDMNQRVNKNFIMSQVLYYFPKASIRHYHKLSG